MAEVPTYSELASVYGLQGTADALERYTTLANDFRNRYGEPPSFFSRAPGRVNVVGEHIDYEGYGVLPMAISRDTVVAIRLSGTTLDVSNHNDAGYAAYSFVPDPSQLVDTEHHVWANYALAAYKGVHGFLDAHPEAHTPTSQRYQGIKLLVHGTVPLGSGLSSSSALVVAVAVAILGAYGCRVSQEAVASFTCACERFVGVASGGMDQAISVMARPGEAAYIQFDPVRASTVPLPPDAAFVVAHSLAVSNKAETAVGRYNLRVVECRLAAILLAINLGYPLSEAIQLKTLREVENIVQLYQRPDLTERSGKAVALPEDVRLLDRCADAAQELLHVGPYLPQTIQDLVGRPLEDLFPDFPAAAVSLAYSATHGGLMLQARAIHVFSEAARVLRFRNICFGAESSELKLMTLGGLLRKSHESCRDRYDCSCPELEDLVVCARRGGALGSRLTGAGWGGASVHLLRQRDVEKFIDGLKKEFYVRRLSSAGDPPPDESLLDSYVFATTPSHGAALVTIDCIISR